MLHVGPGEHLMPVDYCRFHQLLLLFKLRPGDLSICNYHPEQCDWFLQQVPDSLSNSVHKVCMKFQVMVSSDYRDCSAGLLALKLHNTFSQS